MSEITREMWAQSFLRWCGFPYEGIRGRRNMVALIAWQAAEGGPEAPQAKFNPLNTTRRMPGSTDFNWVHVQNYTSESSGLEATARTLFETNPIFGYTPIINRLRRGARPRSTLDAVESSSWGTGGLAKSIVDDVKRSYDYYADKPIGQ